MSTETYTLKVEGYLASQYRLNQFHFEGSGVDTNDTHHAANDLVSAWNLHLQTPWLACFPSTYSLYRISARRTFLKPSAHIDTIFGDLAKPGTRGSDATSQQCCPSVFFVPTMGFAVGGKSFLPCVPQGDLANNAFSAGWIAAVDAYFNAATGGIAGTSYTWQMVIASRSIGGSSHIQSHHLSPFIGFMKKRKLVSGRGRRKKKP